MALTRPTANQIVSTTVDFTDPLIRLNKAQSVANDKDIGIVFERGSDTNTALIWDESADQFALINTTETGSTSGNVNISSYAPLNIGALTSSGISYPISDGTNGQALITNGSGTISFGSPATAGTVTTAAQPNITSVGNLTIANIDNIQIDSNTISSTNTNGNINLTPNGTGEVVAASLSVSDLTSGRLALVGSSGALTDTTDLTWSGSSLTVTGNISGGNLNTAGSVVASTLTSNIATGTAPFTVTSTTQVANLNVATAGSATTAGTVTTAAQPNITSVGTLTSLTTSGLLSVTYAAGDEGGEIFLSKPQTNTTLAGTGVTIDLYQNKLRIFEDGGTNRGAYIDLTSASAGVGSNILGSSAPTQIINGTSNVSVASNANITVNVAGNANIATFTGTSVDIVGALNVSSGLSRFNVPAGTLGSSTGEVNTLQVYQATGNTDAFQSFHISGDYAVHFGLDGTTNDLFVGGWSLGAVKHKIWHAGNDGTGSGLDADTVDGYNPATTSTANTIVLRDADANFSANVITATSTSARYADLAENYLADCLYPIGTVLMVGGEQEVTVAVKDSLPVIGTVSENPGYLMNSELRGNYVTPVAYIGRVPCRVVGNIKRGDRLSPSDIPGVAQSTSSAAFGQSVGIALENYNNTIEGLIEILVGR